MEYKFDDLLHMRCLREDKELLRKASKMDRRSLSDWCRLVLTDAARESLAQKEKQAA